MPIVEYQSIMKRIAEILSQSEIQSNVAQELEKLLDSIDSFDFSQN